ncbi:hypothetical protein M9M90_15665 [Phenylobacterium sp. LH3H17]|uniref:hypothetical protein n=1 Tax=Phenylobacterium sp. LH3H17 TaxID=2903901 RepID=UPI0020C95DCA|nr:hypothetical protein [Phenylobacterium sp. LH3H17]UTP38648.1 hypothetical protein M9M90_15665 [Phenylobacterium sp. LH3H17]
MSRFSTVIVAAGLLALGGCGEAGKSAGAGQDKYAGLDVAIRGWHDSIVASDAECKAKDGKGCQAFEVACKGEREIAPAEQAKGVTTKIVVAMSWEGWDEARAEYRAQSGFAEFNKVGDAWTRTKVGPVNLASCAEV